MAEQNGDLMAVQTDQPTDPPNKVGDYLTTMQMPDVGVLPVHVPNLVRQLETLLIGLRPAIWLAIPQCKQDEMLDELYQFFQQQPQHELRNRFYLVADKLMQLESNRLFKQPGRDPNFDQNTDIESFAVEWIRIMNATPESLSAVADGKVVNDIMRARVSHMKKMKLVLKFRWVFPDHTFPIHQHDRTLLFFLRDVQERLLALNHDSIRWSEYGGTTARPTSSKSTARPNSTAGTAEGRPAAVTAKPSSDTIPQKASSHDHSTQGTTVRSKGRSDSAASTAKPAPEVVKAGTAPNQAAAKSCLPSPTAKSCLPSPTAKSFLPSPTAKSLSKSLAPSSEHPAIPLKTGPATTKSTQEHEGELKGSKKRKAAVADEEQSGDELVKPATRGENMKAGMSFVDATRKYKADHARYSRARKKAGDEEEYRKALDKKNKKAKAWRDKNPELQKAQERRHRANRKVREEEELLGLRSGKK